MVLLLIIQLASSVCGSESGVISIGAIIIFSGQDHEFNSYVDQFASSVYPVIQEKKLVWLIKCSGY